MSYFTDRKRAQGLGSSGNGTHHHWQMMVSSMLLVVLVPLFVVVFAIGYGGTYEEVIAYYSRPFPALVAAGTFVVGIWHVMQETIVAVEDYVPGHAGKLTIVAVSAFSYTLIAVGLFALAKIAF